MDTAALLERYHQLVEELRPFGALLVAVTKNQPVDAVRALYEAGHRHFGENRVQELRQKRPALPDDIHWHMIGHLQTNKVRYLIPWIYLIHSVDRPSLMQELNKRAERAGITIPCLLEVHIATEPTKHGMPPDEARRFLLEGQWQSYPHLDFQGLMGMATYTDDTEQIRREFRLLRRIFEEARPAMPASFQHLSMGMSNDYHIALEEGATIVRIGSRLFQG